MRSMILSSFLVLLTVVFSIPAQGADLLVAPDGSGAYPTIQAAVDVANTGDVIYLLEGTFTGPGNRDLEIDGDVEIRSNNLSNPSIIDCQGSAGNPHKAFYINSGSATLVSLILRNGYGVNGGAIDLTGDLLILENCIFEDNTATGDGGAVYAMGPDSVTMNRCVFAENTAAGDGGAVYAGASTLVEFYRCTLFRNEATSGSGIFLHSDAPCTMDRSIIAFGRGGSACSNYYGGGYTMTCTDIFGNEGGDWVGNLAVQAALDNNISVDPMFCDPMGDPANFALSDPSPVGNSYVCTSLGAKLPDVTWAAPVYGLMADGSGMYPTIQAVVDTVPSAAIIVLEDGTYTGVGNRDIEFRGKSIVVRGRSGNPASVVIDVEGSGIDRRRAFWIHEGEPATTALEYITIRNGYESGNVSPPEDQWGGAIRVTDGASLRITSCRLENNTVRYYLPVFSEWGMGGAVYHSSAGSLLIEGCVFTGNLGSSSLYSASGPVEVLNTDFVGDRAPITFSANSAVTVSGCLIEGFRGTGVSVHNAVGPVLVDSCEFRSDTRTYPGLMVFGCSSVAIDQCLFDQIPLSLLPIMPLVLMDDSGFTATSVTFAGNSIESAGAMKCQNSSGTFLNCAFMGNVGDGVGNALRIEGGVIGLQSCTFSDNSSDTGGAVHAYAADVSFTDCHFTGNEAINQGGGGFFQSSTLAILSSDFSNNTAIEGGGFYADKCSSTVDDCTFDANSDGLRHHGSSLGGLTLTRSTFMNHATGWAAEIDSMLIRPVVIDQCAFRAGNQGLRLFGLPDFRVSNTEFSDNPNNRTFTISNSTGAVDTCSFDRNSGVSEGGALYMLDSNVDLTGCSFADNSSVLEGGAVHLQSGSANFDACIFDRNRSSKHGGALTSRTATAVLDSCFFRDNQADTSGGAVFTFDTQATFNSCTITGGDGGLIGGGGYHWMGNIQYNGGRLAENRADKGGGVIASNAVVNLNNLDVINNSATIGGGVIGFVSDLTMTDCRIVANTAEYAGGLLAEYSGTAQVIRTLIADNESSASGGAVTVHNGTEAAFLQTTIAGNGGVGADAQIFCHLNGSVALSASIVALGTSGPAVAFSDAGSSILIETSNVYGNAGGDWFGPLAGLEMGNCNFSLDPQFCNPNLWNFHLQDTSPCAGVNNPCGLDVGAFGTGCTGVSAVDEPDLPSRFALLGNTPNPFNPRTNICFELPQAVSVVVEVYDLTGRLVRRLLNGRVMDAGRRDVTWNGADDQGRELASGTYLYRVKAEGEILVGKMTLIR